MRLPDSGKIIFSHLRPSALGWVEWWLHKGVLNQSASWLGKMIQTLLSHHPQWEIPWLWPASFGLPQVLLRKSAQFYKPRALFFYSINLAANIDEQCKGCNHYIQSKSEFYNCTNYFKILLSLKSANHSCFCITTISLLSFCPLPWPLPNFPLPPFPAAVLTAHTD